MTLRPALLLVPMLLLACPAQAQHARLTGDSPVQTTPLADSDDADSSAQAVPATAVAMDSTLLAASPAEDEDASTVPPPPEKNRSSLGVSSNSLPRIAPPWMRAATVKRLSEKLR